MTRLKRGDFVRVRLEPGDDWTEAFVGLASDTDPSSVVLLLGDAVRASKGVVINMLPLSIDYAAETVVSLFGDSYTVEVQPRQEAAA
jgi:hypothetical protein